MKLIEINWAPSNRQLRQFGCACLIVLPLVGALWQAGRTVITGLFLAGLVLAACGAFRPRLLAPLFVGLSLVTAPIGLVVGEIAVAMVYVIAIIPIGILGKYLGRDPLQLKRPSGTTTYWQPKEQPTSVSNYYRQS